MVKRLKINGITQNQRNGVRMRRSARTGFREIAGTFGTIPGRPFPQQGQKAGAGCPGSCGLDKFILKKRQKCHSYFVSRCYTIK
ncbi:hypothetical protein HMPREF3293_00067 [Christensenella minuta]|uniref:Uncharacterized protein n=1 Tax=Christensenella minuta TaxID=626937 RepID=A0A136Q8X2_9FIRM|nr:hypothetical protein HMPREF3293_00067 [Christensenella minuta]